MRQVHNKAGVVGSDSSDCRVSFMGIFGGLTALCGAGCLSFGRSAELLLDAGDRSGERLESVLYVCGPCV